MTFFLIVPSVMVVTSFLVHAICNRLGLRIHFLTLLLCAFFAIAANLGALALTDMPDKFYFVKLGIFVSTAALLTTAANYFLIKREIAEEIEFSEQVELLYHEQSESISDDEQLSDKELELSTSNLKIESEKADKVDKVEEIADKIISKTEIKPPVEKVEQKLPDIKTATQPPEKVEEKIIPKVEELRDVGSETREQGKSAKIEFSKPAPKVENLPPPKIEVHGETLDDILDYAYLEKTQGHTWQAIAAYKKALEKYKNDEYAPFVAIDLGNIYKEQAFYTKAIKTYEDALELPAVRRSASTKAEFKKNLIYLKTVQSVLLRHKALSTPFSKISRAYLQEIESEFQAMQLKFEDR